MQADLRIATGLIEPHLMAGYSGGRKVITPGIAHADTITTLHNYQFMSDPRAVNCNLDGNPLHEEQLEAVQMIGGAMALNTVIDDKRRLAFVNFGEVVDSHLEAVAFMRPYAEVRTGGRFTTVVTSSAGYPLDKTFYQTIKGMVGPLGILADGGDLIIASRCEEADEKAKKANKSELVQDDSQTEQCGAEADYGDGEAGAAQGAVLHGALGFGEPLIPAPPWARVQEAQRSRPNAITLNLPTRANITGVGHRSGIRISA